MSRLVYLLRFKVPGRPTYDVLVEAPELPRVGDELELGEFGALDAVRGRGALGSDPPATFWVEVVHRSLEPRPEATAQLREVDPVLVVARSTPVRIAEIDR